MDDEGKDWEVVIALAASAIRETPRATISIVFGALAMLLELAVRSQVDSFRRLGAHRGSARALRQVHHG